MFLENKDESQSVAVRPPDPSTIGEVFSTAWDRALYVDNVVAKGKAIEEAYDARIDAVFAATGQRLVHPMRRGTFVEDADFGTLDVEGGDYFRDFQAELARLAKQHPDLIDVIQPGRSPREDALVKRNQVAKAADLAFEGYHGTVPGSGNVAAFAGAMAGGFQDPVNLSTMFIGPTKAAGLGIKGLLWMALKQGAANASVETAFQPAIAAWRTEAGIDAPSLGYGAEDFALNVGSAFAIGGAVDFGVRGTFRGVQHYRGRAPVLEDGRVVGWKPADQALDDAARASGDDVLAKAADGDFQSLRDAAYAMGADRDPAVKALIEALEDTQLTQLDLPPEIGRIEAETFEQDLMRHAVDPREPMPLVPGENVPVRVLEDDLPPPPEQPGDLKGLSDRAVELVASGEADVSVARTVARFVPPERQAEIIASISKMSPSSPAEVRRAIAVLMAPGDENQTLPRGTLGIDDVAGPDGERQTMSIEQWLTRDAAQAAADGGGSISQRAVAARFPGRETRLTPEQMAEPDFDHTKMRIGFPELDELENPFNSARLDPATREFSRGAARLLDAARRAGVYEVQAEMARIGPAAVRDAFGRLVKGVEFDRLSEFQRGVLLTAGALRKWADGLADNDPLKRFLSAHADAVEDAAIPPARILSVSELEALIPIIKPPQKRVAHPQFSQLELPMRDDGTVRFYRGDDPTAQPRGSGGQLWTTTFKRALKNAGNGGFIRIVDVPVDELAEAVPRWRGDKKIVKPGEDVFALSDELAAGGRRVGGEAETLIEDALRAVNAERMNVVMRGEDAPVVDMDALDILDRAARKVGRSKNDAEARSAIVSAAVKAEQMALSEAREANPLAGVDEVSALLRLKELVENCK